MRDIIATFGFFFVVLVLFAFGVMVMTVLGPWLRARLGRAPVGWWRLCGMALRRTDLGAVVDAHIMAVGGDVDAPLRSLEAHVLARGNVRRTMVAAVAAKKAEVDFPFRMAAAADLTGRDAVEIVQELIRAKQERLHELADELTAEMVGELIGGTAEVVQAVGPPGIVALGDWKMNAVSDGGFLSKGTIVQVIGAKDNVVVVQPTTAK